MSVRQESNSSIAKEDDWGLPLDFQLFAQYECHTINVDKYHSFKVECEESLTPIDMVSLSNEVHDATGFCVWTGAFLLIMALDELECYFAGQKVLELGCGTGISGLTLLRSPSTVPLHLVLTDADPNALALCRRNLDLNDSGYVQVEELLWGDALPSTIAPNSLDTVFAADILYDIGSLPNILDTCRRCLREGGTFVLSHVPRACFSEDHPPPRNGLDEYICQQAEKAGFATHAVIYPKDITGYCHAISSTFSVHSLTEMQEIAAAVFVFKLVK